MDAYDHRRLPDRLIKEFTRMILEGLVSIHRLGYVHCDLKPANILVFPRENGRSGSMYKIKLADFGLSREAMKEVGDWWSLDSPFCGTSIYMSPELVCEGKFVAELDLWSLGCIVLEMYTGQLPWPRSEIDFLAHFLWNGDAPTVPETVPCDARKFIETCFARNPEERSNASELLEHMFLCGEKKPQVDEKTGKIVNCTHRMPPPGFVTLPARAQPCRERIISQDEDSELVLRSLQQLAISMLNGDLSS